MGICKRATNELTLTNNKYNKYINKVHSCKCAANKIYQKMRSCRCAEYKRYKKNA